MVKTSQNISPANINADPRLALSFNTQICGATNQNISLTNINADPRLTPDFHLMGDSPCIDKGTNGHPLLPTTDFEGDARVIDGDGDGTPSVDIGADELVPGSITIIKDALPNNAQSFQFTGDLGSFTLVDDTGGSNSRTFTRPPGIYTVAETVPAGWDLVNITCSDPDGQTVATLGTASAAIDLDSGEGVVCTFSNGKHGSITIVKDAVPNISQLFTFSGDLGGFSLYDDGSGANSRTFADLAPGSYSVAEIVAVGWNLTGITCVDPDGGTTVNLAAANATIDLDYGESIICTFTNTPQTAPPVTHYMLSVAVDPSLGGAVTGNGISCPADCEESYNAGTPVILTAVPSQGYVFDHWTGCYEPSNLCTVTMNSDIGVTAHFRQRYDLTVRLCEPLSGRVVGEGINCPTGCKHTYPASTTVTLTAVPNEGALFTGWVGCDSASGTQCTVSVGLGTMVWALFTPQTGMGSLYSEPYGLFGRKWLLCIPVIEIPGNVAHAFGAEAGTYWMLLEYLMREGYFTVLEKGRIIIDPSLLEQITNAQLQNGVVRLYIPELQVGSDPSQRYLLILEINITDTDVRITVVDFGLI